MPDSMGWGCFGWGLIHLCTKMRLPGELAVLADVLFLKLPDLLRLGLHHHIGHLLRRYPIKASRHYQLGRSAPYASSVVTYPILRLFD